MKRAFPVLVAVVAVAIALQLIRPALAQPKQRHLELPQGPALDARARAAFSLDSSIGFIAPAAGDTLVAFAVGTGEVIGELSGHGRASGIAVAESPGRRLLAITSPNDPANGLPATVTIVDATTPSDLRVASIFSLPESVRLSETARAEIDRKSTRLN